MDFFFGPSLAFFSKRYYHKVLQKGFGFGFLYLLYLSLLFGFLAIFLINFFLLPVLTGFSSWVVSVTPEIKITQSGLEAAVKQPYTIKHPSFGPLCLIDTGKSLDALLKSDRGEVVLIGKEQIVIRNRPRHRTEVIELYQLMSQIKKKNQPIVITKQTMRDYARQIRRYAAPVVLFSSIIMFFIWKLMTVVFYSMFAMFLNMFRKEKLTYKSLFALSCFAITPISVIQWMNISIPGMHFNTALILSIGLTVAYIAYGLFSVPHKST